MPTENRSSDTDQPQIEAASAAMAQIRTMLGREQRPDQVAAALEACDWSDSPIGNKAIVLSAIQVLRATQPNAEPIAWMVGTAFWWTKEEAERDAAETGLPIVGLGPMAYTAEVERLRAVIEQQKNLIESLRAELVESHSIDASAEPSAPVPFQARVQPWLMQCFGEMIAGDREERNHRFLEESLELIQALGATAYEAHQLVDYVFGRDVGEPAQEVGGVMVTLAALCLANGFDMHKLAEKELARIWTKVDAIRAKQASKPQFGPLPGVYPGREPSAPVEIDELVDFTREHERLWPFPLEAGPATQWQSQQDKARRLEGWKARAALERKPQVKP